MTVSASGQQHILVAFLKKPADQHELDAILKEVQPTRIYIFYFTLGRIDQSTIEDWPCLQAYSDSLSIESIKTKELNSSRLQQLIKHIDDVTHIAMPLCSSSVFYRSVRQFRRDFKVIHISDGISESFGLIGFCMGFRLYSPSQYWKTPLACLLYRLNRADYSYSVLPIKSPFANRTIHCSPVAEGEDMYSYVKSIVGDDKNRVQIIGGWDIEPASFCQRFGISRYIASTKGKEVIIDGQLISTDRFVTSEQLSDILRPPLIIGGCSTGVVYGKVISPDSECVAIRTGLLNKKYGPLFEHYFSKTARNLGVVCGHEKEIEGVLFDLLNKIRINSNN